MIFLFDVYFSVYTVGARFCFGQSKVYRQSGRNSRSSGVYLLEGEKVVVLTNY